MGTSSELPHVGQVKILGHELCRDFRQGTKVVQARKHKAIQCVDRVALAGLHPEPTQAALMSAALPKYAYGLQHRPMPMEAHSQMKAALKRAMCKDKKIHSWEMLGVAVFPAHLLDPHLRTAFTHLRAIIQGIREGGDVLFEEWKATKGIKGSRPRGPRATFEVYAQRLGITESEDGEEWKSEGSCMRIRTTPMKQILHFFREIGRRHSMRALEGRRLVYQGVRDIDIAKSTCLTRIPRTPYRPQLIRIVCEGVWTAHRKALAGIHESGIWMWCGREESLTHLWYECDRWEASRSLLKKWREYLQRAPRCVRECFIAVADLPSALAQQWREVQLEAAQLLRLRMNQEHEKKVPRIPKMSLSEAWQPQRERDRIWGAGVDFYYVERIYNKAPTWPYSGQAWKEMNAWASMLRHDNSEQPPPTILECYLSFLWVSGGQRWLTDIDEGSHGHWISRQLHAFGQALNAFQKLAAAMYFFDPDGSKPGKAEWGRIYGLPTLDRIYVSLCLPGGGTFDDVLESAATQIGTSHGMAPCAEAWRRWTPGQGGTQMTHEHRNWAPSLRDLARRRIRVKGPLPTWRRQALLDGWTMVGPTAIAGGHL